MPDLNITKTGDKTFEILEQKVETHDITDLLNKRKYIKDQIDRLTGELGQLDFVIKAAGTAGVDVPAEITQDIDKTK